MYPVTLTVVPQVDGRRRLTVAARPILAIPHAILVGPVVWSGRGASVGLLGAVAYMLAIVSWCTLLFGGQHLAGIRELTRFYLRWRVRALAYMGLFTDGYPPFGDGPYPASIEIVDPPGPRDRLSIALRLLLAIPHLIVLGLLLVAWFFITVVAWIAILFTGRYPEGVLDFAIGVMRWNVRTEAYLLLMVDEYPPFTLEEAGGVSDSPAGVHA